MLKFKSKIDLWLRAVIWVSVAMIALGFIQVTRDVPAAESTAAGLVTAFVLGVVLVGTAWLMLWIYYGTHYTFASDALQIRSGPFRWDIKYADIKSVRASRNPLSSPALSLDRLAIRRYSRRYEILVSPLDREAFLKALRERTPETDVVLG